MAATSTYRGFRGLTARDRDEWVKQYQAQLQGLTKDQIDNLFDTAVIKSRLGNKSNYSDILMMPIERQKELYNDQTYLDDFSKRFGNQTEFNYRDGTIPFDFLNTTLTDDAKIKLAKNPKFRSDKEIQDRYNKSIKDSDDLEKELDNQPWWQKFLRSFANQPHTEEESIFEGSPGETYDPAHDKQVNLLRKNAQTALDSDKKWQKNILEDVINEDNLNSIKEIEDDGEVDTLLNKWIAEGDKHEAQRKGAGEEYQASLLQSANDLLNGKTVLFNGQFIETPGSNYYKAFKNTHVFDKFGNDDKLRMLAIYNILADKKGPGFAMNAIESKMEEYVHNNQSKADWAKNTGNDVVVGGVANIANKLMGYEGLYVGIRYGDKGLAEWLNGIDPETGKPMTGWWQNRFFNPNYWRKVEDYGTFDEVEHAAIDRNGGITSNHNIYGTHAPKLWSWQTANEALKMTKFLWSDYLVGRVLGAGSKFATKAAGGKYSVTGEFMAKEGPHARRANAVNKLAAVGTVITSAIGISEAYGKMTFDQVQRSGYDLIMKDINANVDKLLADEMEKDNTKQAIESYVIDKSNQAAAAGWTEEQIAQQQPEWRKEATEYAQIQLRNTLTEQQKAEHKKDFDEADRAAAWGYITDATLEQARMSLTNAMFRKYIFDKGTRQALSTSNPYLKNTTTLANGTEVSTRANSIRLGFKKPYMGVNVRGDRYREAVKSIGNGFFSNYLDDVTVGFGKGFGNKEFHDYMAKKYDPANFDNNTENIWYRIFADVGAGLEGAQDATTDYQSFYDGMIGMLGSLTNVGFKTQGWRELFNKNKSVKTDSEGNRLSRMEILNKFFVHPILDSYATAREQERQADQYLEKQNKTLRWIMGQVFRKKADEIEGVNEVLTNMNAHQLALEESKTLQESIDAKTDFRYSLMRHLHKLAHSPVYEHNEWVASTRQQIKDVAEQNVSEEQKQTMIDQFLAQPMNRTQDETSPISREDAWNRIVENAKELQQMDQRIDEISKQVNKDPNVYNDEQSKEKLIYQRVRALGNSERLKSLDEKITGAPVQDTGLIPQYNTSRSDYAEFGTHKAWEMKKTAQEERVAELEERLEEAKKSRDDFKKELAKKGRKAKHLAENYRNGRMLDFTVKSLSDRLKDAKRELERINIAERIFLEPIAPNEEAGETVSDVKVNNEHGVVLSREEIMALDPLTRAEILNPQMIENYSKEQQDIIRDLVTEKTQENESFFSDLMDSANLYERLRNDAKSYRLFLENPIESLWYEEGFKIARVKALYDNIERTQERSIFDSITEAINNDTLDDFLKKTNLRSNTFKRYLKKNEETLSDEIKEKINNHIKRQEIANNNYQSLFESIDKDKDISKEDKILLGDMIEFFQLHNIDPTDENMMIDALQVNSINNINITAYESLVNSNNERRPVGEKVQIRPNNDPALSSQAQAKINSLYTILRQKMNAILKDRQTEESVNPPTPEGAPVTGESAAAEEVEPTPEPEPAPTPEPEGDGGETPQRAKEDEPFPTDANEMMRMRSYDKDGVTYKDVINWLHDHPEATAEDLEGAMNLSPEDALDFVRYFRIIKPPRINDTGTGTPPPAPQEPEPAEESDTIDQVKEKIYDTVDSIINKAADSTAYGWFKRKIKDAISSILSIRHVEGEDVTDEDKKSVLTTIKTVLDALNNNAEDSPIDNDITSKIISGLRVASNVAGKIGTLIRLFTNAISSKVKSSPELLRTDPFDEVESRAMAEDHTDTANVSRIASINANQWLIEHPAENPGEEGYFPGAAYIRDHRIWEFMQSLEGNIDYLKDKPVYFISPGEWNSKWLAYIQEKQANNPDAAISTTEEIINAAPLVAVIEITKEELNRINKDVEWNPVTIDGKLYQPIAVMPASGKNTLGSNRLKPIRQQLVSDGETNVALSNQDKLITLKGTDTVVESSFVEIVRDDPETSSKWPEQIPEDQPNRGILDAVTGALRPDVAARWDSLSKEEKHSGENKSLLKTLAEYCLDRLGIQSFVPKDKKRPVKGLRFFMNNGKSDSTNFRKPVMVVPIDRTTLRGGDETITQILAQENIDDAIDKLIVHSDENSSILDYYFTNLKKLLVGREGLLSKLNNGSIVFDGDEITVGEDVLNKWIDELNKQLGYSISLKSEVEANKAKYRYRIVDGIIHLDLVKEDGSYIADGENLVELTVENMSRENINRLMFDMLKNTILNRENKVRTLDGKPIAKWAIDYEWLTSKNHRDAALERIMDGLLEVSMTSLVYPKHSVVVRAPFAIDGTYQVKQPATASRAAAAAGAAPGTIQALDGKGREINTDSGTIMGKNTITPPNMYDRAVSFVQNFISKLQAKSQTIDEARRKSKEEGVSRIPTENPTLAVTTFINAIDEVMEHDPYGKTISVDLNDSASKYNPVVSRPFTISNGESQFTLNSIEAAYEAAKYELLFGIAAGNLTRNALYGGSEVYNKFKNILGDVISTDEQRTALYDLISGIINAKSHRELQDAIDKFNTELDKPGNEAFKEFIKNGLDEWNNPEHGIKQAVMNYITRQFLKQHNLKPGIITEFKGGENLEFREAYRSAITTLATEKGSGAERKTENGVIKNPNNTDVAAALGNVMDEFLKDFFDETTELAKLANIEGPAEDNIITGSNTTYEFLRNNKHKVPRAILNILQKYPNMSPVGLIKFYQDIHAWKMSKINAGWTFVSRDLNLRAPITIKFSDGTETTVVLDGQIDLIAYNDKGEVELYDFKTMKFDSKTEQENIMTGKSTQVYGAQTLPVKNPAQAAELQTQFQKGSENVAPGVGLAKHYVDYLKRLYREIFKWKHQQSAYSYMTRMQGDNTRGTVKIIGINIINATLRYEAVNPNGDSRYMIDESTSRVLFNQGSGFKELGLTPVFQPVIDNDMITRMTGSPVTDDISYNKQVLEALLQQKGISIATRRALEQVEAAHNDAADAINQELNPPKQEENPELPEEPQSPTPEITETPETPDPPKDIVEVSGTPPPPAGGSILGDFDINLDNGFDSNGGIGSDEMNLPGSPDLMLDVVEEQHPGFKDYLKQRDPLWQDSDWTSPHMTDEIRERLKNCFLGL